MAGTGYLWYFSGMTERQALQFQREFFARIGGGLQLAELFESLPMVAFFAKDERSRFVRANARTLQIFNLQYEWQMLGKLDQDYYPRAISAGFLEEDQRVLRTGKAITRYTQLVPDITGPLRWYIVTKAPLRDPRGNVRGVAIAMYELHDLPGVLQPFQRLESALRHMHTHFHEPVETKHLAALAHLSESQFTRLFRKVLGESPMRYLIRLRIDAASHDLIATDHTAGTIALDCGFYDQSAFTRVFRAQKGLTPAAYRRRQQVELQEPRRNRDVRQR